MITEDELLKSVPKRVATRFSETLATLEQLQAKNRTYTFGTVKQQQKYFADLTKCTRFFHMEMSKFYIDMYAETIIQDEDNDLKHVYGFSYDLNSSHKFITFSIFEKENFKDIFGGFDKMMRMDNYPSYDDRYSLKQLSERISLLFEWRTGFHYYIKKKGKPLVKERDDFAF